MLQKRERSFRTPKGALRIGRTLRQRFDVSLALRQNVSVRYSGDLQQGTRCARHNLENLFVGLGES